MARVSLFQPGAKYEIFAGRLYVRDRRQTLTVKPWGNGMGAWRLEGLTSWGPADLSVDVRELAVAGLGWAEFLLKQWPAEVVRAVASFEISHWTLLRLANAGGAAYVELLESNAGLGAALAWAVERGRTVEEAVAWVGLKRRRILSVLGVEETERAVKVLGKVPADEIDSGLYNLLEGLREGWEEMSYWPRVTARSAALLVNPELRLLTTRDFRREFARAGRARQTAALRVLQSAAGHVEAYRVELPPARRLSNLDEYSRQVWRIEERLEDMRQAKRRFAPPPIPPGPGMEPIRSIDELRAEGVKMHHCCASYLQDVRSGKLYFYRMLEPERLTVCVEKQAEGWRLREVRGVANRAAGQAALERLAAWAGGPLGYDMI